MSMVRGRRRAFTGILAASALAFSGAVALAIPAIADGGDVGDAIEEVEELDDLVFGTETADGVDAEAEDGVDGHDGAADQDGGEDAVDDQVVDGIDTDDVGGDSDERAVATVNLAPQDVDIITSTLTVRVENADGAAVEGASVYVCETNCSYFGATGIDGKVSGERSLGDRRVEVIMSIDGSSALFGEAEVTIGAEPASVTVVLDGAPGAEPDPETATLIVNVVDKNGAPVSDAVIRLCDAAADCFDHGITGPDGSATNAGLEATFLGEPNAFGIHVYIGGNTGEPDGFQLVTLDGPVTTATVVVDLGVTPPVEDGTDTPTDEDKPTTIEELPTKSEDKLAVTGADLDLGLAGFAAALMLTGLTVVTLSKRRQRQDRTV